MVLSLAGVPANATLDDPTDTPFSSGTVTVDGTSDKTVTLNWTVGSDDYVVGIEGDIYIASKGNPNSADGNVTLTDLTMPNFTLTMYDEIVLGTGHFLYNGDPSGYLFNAGDILLSATFTVDKDTPAGTYPVYIDVTEFIDVGGAEGYWDQILTATITVQEPSAQPEWEIYYTLDGATDSDTDKYIEYNPGDTVIATIYLKAKAADTLQAFDFTVTNDENLQYVTYSSANGTRIESGTAQSTATSQHIQAVGADKDHPINVAMAANTGVEIATITYQVKDAAVYNTGMPITITAADFAVAENPAGFTPDIQSYSSDTLGAETLKTYDVTYDENKPAAASALTVTGMPATNPDAKQHNVAYSVAAAPSLTNYTFAGWNTAADGTGDSYTAGGSYAANADVTLYAQWTPDTHKVEWKSQDGSTILETDTSVAYGAALSFDGTEPTKTADAEFTYNFAGWSTTANAETGAAANTFTMGDADMVLYAAFSKETNKYTVTWYNQAGDSAIETDANVPYGTAPSFDSAEPQKADDADGTYKYTFAGWATTANQESGSDVNALPTVAGDTDYFAAFSKEYIDHTITYALGDHPADGETAPAPKTDAHVGVVYNLPAAPNAADGYTFTGWSDGENIYAAGASYTPTGDKTLTAQYSENHYTVHYDLNAADATGTVPADKNLAYTEAYTVEAGTGLARNGYTFAGWNTAADGSGTTYSVGDSVSKLAAADGATVTLYAKWSTAAYTIEYNYDGATTTPANTTEYDVEDLPITLTRPEKTGYTFESWTITVKSGETGNAVVDGDTIKAGTYGNLTVKANWTPAEVDYTVNHYWQNVTGSDYTLHESETKQGLTEANTAAAAKTYEHFTAGHTDGDAAGTVTQVVIAPTGTVVNIYYERETYTVTYAYSGNVPSGYTAPADENSPYRYGATVTVKDAVSAPAGYTFEGWSQTGTFVIDANTTITGNWSLVTYYINFKNDQGTLVEAVPFTAETASITAPAVPAKTDDAAWYDAGTWGAYDITNLADQNVTPTYNKLTFTITFLPETGDDPLPDQGTDNHFAIDDSTIVPPAVPDKPGYTGSWPIDTTKPGDVSIRPTYTPISYTITFDTDGGTAIAAMTYTIESTDTLPSATGKTNFAFQNWKVTTADGNWAADSTINGGSAVTGKYGNVTLTAQWTQNLSYEVQEYKYAPTGYKLLIIDAEGAGDGNVYTFDGAVMYYTTDTNYQIGTSTGVFYTLIQATGLTLSDEQVGKIAASAGTRTLITDDWAITGDINGDGVRNIADANAIFQMVANGGGYYSLDQLNILPRLRADMVTDRGGTSEEYRGSIEDVNAVVNLINGIS